MMSSTIAQPSATSWITIHRSFILPLIILLLLPSNTQTQNADLAYSPECPDSFSGYRSGPACKSYYVCSEGLVVSPITECMFGTIFNEFLSVCDFEYNFECGSTRPPSNRPTKKPTMEPIPRLEPTTPYPTMPPQTRSPSANVGIEDALENARRDIDKKLFIYQSGWSDWLPSTQYRYDGFLRGLQLMYLEGVGGMTFYLGEDVGGVEGTKVGLVNIAAFLAQSMKETIKYDACDENNWDIIDGMYPLSNACGQLEQSYQDYVCPPGSEHMQCEVDPDMEQKATTQANWYGAPGPLFCGPKSKYPFVGYWDYSHMCDFPWKDPPELCTDYPGQKGGQAVNDEPVANANGRTDVEGCCWWGRGVIQTTGICNFGMLNYFLGKKAADEGRDSRYPHIDFCKDPGAVCSRADHPELKWIAGMFYWVRSLQTYDEGWSYMDNLKAFVRGGMSDGSFIDAVSGIVNRGCHNPPCGTGPLDGGYERKENFNKVLDVLLEADGSPRIQRDLPTYYPTTYAPTSTQHDEPNPVPPPTVPLSYQENEAFGADTLATDEWVDEEDDSHNSAVILQEVQGEEEEEEDWSSAATSTMNLWCGETQYNAFENCGRNGYDCLDGICFNGLKCFMVSSDDCVSEKEDEAPPLPLTPPPTAEPTPRPIAPAIIAPPPTPMAATEPAPLDNTGLRQNYCAKSLAILATSCVTATTCEKSEDCPAGTYCWGDHMCGGTDPPTPPPTAEAATPLPTYQPTEKWDTYSPTGNGAQPRPQPQPQPQPPDDKQPSFQFDVKDTFFCGSDRSHASTSCHKRCRSGSHDECDGEETCFGYTSCKAESPLAQPAADQSQSTQQPTKGPTKEPTQEPTAQPTPKANDGSQSSTAAVQQLFCAKSMSELETSCGTAQSCMSGPCPKGNFCFPFTCAAASAAVEDTPVPVESQQQLPAPAENQQPPPSENQNQQPPLSEPAEPQANQGLCPQNTFVGWHATLDCKEYFRCDNGAMGIVHVCGTSMKFDKVRNQCYPEQDVNSFCYGPPLEQAQAAQQGTGQTVISRDLCKGGYTGWGSRLGCREYYWCNKGQADVIYDCGEDLLFDTEMELCNFKQMVLCGPEGGVPMPAQNTNHNSNPNISNASNPSSSSTNSMGLQSSAPTESRGPTPKPVITFPPTTSEPPSSEEDVNLGGTPSSSSGGTNGGFSWSYTATPTVPTNASDIPPWLKNTIMEIENGGDDVTMRSSTWSILAFVALFQMLFFLW